jgi:hypothetical protein
MEGNMTWTVRLGVVAVAAVMLAGRGSEGDDESETGQD